ncbi:BLUF domain-containing protein [Blastomonas aquatica]|uniref:BLUF domain-containing protein n=1 Tax=Blastomonas aquatica TaxID=1510276 RepID=UPI001E4CE786|nr:BLUF domain-containing protein [Blastomonas aquatica]
MLDPGYSNPYARIMEAQSPMLTQLIYMSQPFGYDGATLSGILSSARRNNPRLGITGALICRHDIYLQLLEGPPQSVDTLFQSISSDDRHLAVTLLHRADVDHRLFPEWAMLHDPAHSWHWSPDEVASGAITEASPEVLRQVFQQAAADTSVAARQI